MRAFRLEGELIETERDMNIYRRLSRSQLDTRLGGIERGLPGY